MNDHLLWRLVITDPNQKWFYGEEYEQPKDFYRFFTYSSTDLYKKGLQTQKEVRRGVLTDIDS